MLYLSIIDVIVYQVKFSMSKQPIWHLLVEYEIYYT